MKDRKLTNFVSKMNMAKNFKTLADSRSASSKASLNSSFLRKNQEYEDILKDIEYEQRLTKKSFGDCCAFNKNDVMFRNIQVDKIIDMTIDKSKKLKLYFQDHLVTAEIIMAVKQSPHFQLVILKTI